MGYICSKICLQGTLWWEDTLYTVKPVFKGHSDERTPSIQSNLSPRYTLMRGHPLYSQTCLQGTLWWEDTLYTVKPVFKGHSDERTPSIQSNLSSRDTLMRGHPLYSKTCLQGTLWWDDTNWPRNVFSERFPIFPMLNNFELNLFGATYYKNIYIYIINYSVPVL